MFSEEFIRMKDLVPDRTPKLNIDYKKKWEAGLGPASTSLYIKGASFDLKCPDLLF
jgi:hypothetical protein